MKDQDVLFKQIFGRNLNRQTTVLEMLRKMEDLGLIDYGELAELAVSRATGIDRCGKNHPDIDLVNGAQIKMGTTNDKATQKVAYIAKKQHTENLYAVVRNKDTKKDYFFMLPYSDYRHKQGNTIGIPFNKDGSPYLNNKWWQYSLEFNHFAEAVMNHA